MYNLIEYGHIYLKTSGRLWQYYRNEPSLDNNNNVITFLLITIIVFCSNLKSKEQDKQETMAQKI